MTQETTVATAPPAAIMEKEPPVEKMSYEEFLAWTKVCITLRYYPASGCEWSGCGRSRYPRPSVPWRRLSVWMCRCLKPSSECWPARDDLRQLKEEDLWKG